MSDAHAQRLRFEASPDHNSMAMDFEVLRARVKSLCPAEVPQEDDKYLTVIVPHTISAVEEIKEESDIILAITNGVSLCS